MQLLFLPTVQLVVRTSFCLKPLYPWTTLSEDLLYKTPLKICWDINYCVPFQNCHGQRVTQNSEKSLARVFWYSLTRCDSWGRSLVSLAGQAIYIMEERRGHHAASSNAIPTLNSANKFQKQNAFKYFWNKCRVLNPVLDRHWGKQQWMGQTSSPSSWRHILVGQMVN